MSYRVYIKKDYKPVVRWTTDVPWYRRHKPWLFTLVFCSVVTFIASAWHDNDGNPNNNDNKIETPAAPALTDVGTIPDIPHQSSHDFKIRKLQLPEQTPSRDNPEISDKQSIPWQTVTVKPGDSLSLIFDRLKLKPVVLHQIISLGKDTNILKQLMPGNQLYFKIDSGGLQSLKYEQSLTTALLVSRNDNGFTSETVKTELQIRVLEVDAAIENSLFLSGQNAGLSDNLIMQMVAIFGWDIDFALDIRAGDRFKIIYEERYKEGQKVNEGPILAAEFINQERPYRAVRYTSIDGDSNYYNEKGLSMRKAFLRTPVNFSRISSRFNLRRKHPILNRIRAHKGVDYSAPTGTPVKATGDGTVIRVGKKGGYGKTVILKHGGTYSTLYAHLSRYAKSIKAGKRVKQGQIIGYVGSTGLATGPHLHYEFRINGVHRNPLTVKLPTASGVPQKEMVHFKQQTAPLLAQLSKPATEKTILALQDNQLSSTLLD